ADGSYEEGTLNISGDLDEIELIGECAELADLITGQITGISGTVESTITDGPVPEPEPEDPTTTTEADDSTTTTEAEDSPEPDTPGNGATPIPATPSYTG